MTDGKLHYLGVSTTEKLPRGITLRAEGSSGHGSVFPAPITLSRISLWPSRKPEIGLHRPDSMKPRAPFEGLAMMSPPEEAAWYRNGEDPESAEEILRVERADLLFHAARSVVPTILKAGFKSHVIPPTAEGVLDVRALPDEDLGKFRATLAQLIDDPQVKVIAEGHALNMVAAPPSQHPHCDVCSWLEKAQAQVFPDSITLPVMQQALPIRPSCAPRMCKHMDWQCHGQKPKAQQSTGTMRECKRARSGCDQGDLARSNTGRNELTADRV